MASRNGGLISELRDFPSDVNVRKGKEHLFAAGLAVMAALGADHWLRALARGVGVAFCFHHVRPWVDREFAPNRVLEITPDFLERILRTLHREGFEIISLDDVPERLHAPRTARPFVVLSFDDGYSDNLRYAWPILRKYQAPWTVFVVVDFMNHRGQLWWVALEEAIRRCDRIDIPLENRSLAFDTETRRKKEQAFFHLRQRLQVAETPEREAAIEHLAVQAHFEIDELVRTHCARWADIRSLACDPLVTIGCHTLSHAVLSRVSEVDARREIKGAKEKLEYQLSRPIRHIAYPHGERGSATVREFSIARDAGFETGWTIQPSHLFAHHATRLWSLPRVSIRGQDQHQWSIRALASGVPFLFFGGSFGERLAS